MKTTPRMPFAALFCAIAAMTASANTNTWTGGNGGFGYQWIDSCWDAGSKPGSGDVARFENIQRFIDRINAGGLDGRIPPVPDHSIP